VLTTDEPSYWSGRYFEWSWHHVWGAPRDGLGRLRALWQLDGCARRRCSGDGG